MPTPITLENLEDASEDVATISRVANDVTVTTTTRNGGTIDTLYGAMSKLKYSVPVAHANGLNVTVATFTVLNAGVVYAPLISALPFTTTGTFDSGKWYPIAPLFSTFTAGIMTSVDAAAFRTAIGAAATGVIDLNALTTDTTGGALGDFFPFVDISETNASNKATLVDILKTFIAALTLDATPDLAADHAITLDASAATIKKILLQSIGAGKQTIWIPAGAMITRTTNGAALVTSETTTNKVMFKTLNYDTATQEFSQAAIRMPKSWNEGTVTFIPIWSHPATTVNFGVAFSLAGVAISDNEALDVAFGTAVVVVDTGGTTDRLYHAVESGAVTIAGTPATGDVVVFQVARVPADAGDNMAVDARLHGIVILYTTDVNTDL